jgi:hypothetical protein
LVNRLEHWRSAVLAVNVEKSRKGRGAYGKIRFGTAGDADARSSKDFGFMPQ